MKKKYKQVEEQDERSVYMFHNTKHNLYLFTNEDNLVGQTLLLKARDGKDSFNWSWKPKFWIRNN